MARNIEIKARIENVTAIVAQVAALADGGPIEIIQDDTFFSCPNGRMKLRTLSATQGELIFYRRSDCAGPKESFYLISATTAPGTLREILSSGYGQVGRVRKHRTLFLVGRTRIHIDQVENLGDFIELEVVLADAEGADSGEAIARDLMKKLGISSNQLCEGAYIDLLALECS
ncbi:CYTH domain-containing protein [candidate division KSB1 bacterium]|nr:MAG: CYTH domain-containing protein [candidate division KSB1 bacterium]